MSGYILNRPARPRLELFMKFFHAVFVSCAAILPAAGQTTNSAALVGWCRSLSLELGDAVTLGGSAQAAFSTYDGVANSLQIDSRYSVVSDELRARPGMPGVYETDYGLFRPAPVGFFEVGNMVFTLPTTDADSNGVPDVVQVNQSGHVSSLTAAGREDSPLQLDFMATGAFSRNAGADLGSYNLAWATIGGGYTLSGSLRVLHLEGEADYTRASSNVMRFRFTLHADGGTSLVLTGSTAYTVRNVNEVQLPQFKLRGGSLRFTVEPTTLARAGQRYAGNFRFTDLLLQTSWRDYVDWAVEITDATDANTNGIPDLSDPLAVPDFTAPKVGISVPVANARLSNDVVIVQGTASDDRGVTEVLYSLNGAPLTNASGTNIWYAPVTLRPGTNTVVVQALDAATNRSAVVPRRFVYVVTSPLTVDVDGAGFVTPDLDGHLLEVGRRYTVTALPSKSNLFAGWSGDIDSAAAKLTFTMASNLVLNARFVTNPFIPQRGAYTGLFAESAAVFHETSGYFAAKLKDSGAFSGSLKRGGRTHAFSGQFALDGKATNRIRLNAASLLDVVLCLDLTNGTERITGTLAEGERVAVLVANRTQPRGPGNPAGRFPGRYTMALAPLPGMAGPAGAGVASVTTDTNGNARFSGYLADGSAWAASGPISKDGFFPLYQVLYGGKGSVFSPLQFTNDPELMCSGDVSWIKPTRPADRLYAGGFTNVLNASGAIYTRDALTNALAATPTAGVQIVGLPTPGTSSAVLWNRATRMTNNLGMSLTLSSATGLWIGIYPEPQSGRRLPFKTTLQPGPGMFFGAGYVVQSNISGLVNFTLAPVP